MTAWAFGQGAIVDIAGRPRRWLLWTIAFAGCAAAAAAAVMRSDIDEQAAGVDAALVAWITLAYVVCGLVAWSRRPQSGFGRLMVAAGFGPLLSTLSEVDEGLPRTVGVVCLLLPVVLFLHVFLAYPSGRLERPVERFVIVAGYTSAIGLGLVAMTLGPSEWESAIEIVSLPGAGDRMLDAGRIAIVVVALVSLCLLAGRARASRRTRRRSLVRVCFALAIATVALAVLGRLIEWPAFEPLKLIAFAMIGLAPVLLLVGFLRAHLARSAVADLFVQLRAEPGPADIQDALARVLRDPSLTLVYWLPEFGGYADLDGREVDVRELGVGRAVTLIDRGGAHLAALLHDPALDDEPELLDAVTAAAGIALENGRLQAELRARLEELKGSRARIVDAGQAERKRLERNLHDGAQQRLVALSLELDLLEEQLGPGSASTRLDVVRRQVAVSLEELRELAGGLHPAVVTAHGLGVALEELAAHAPVPVRLTVDTDGRLAEPLEVAAYYVVSESLANIGKHARASSATIAVAKTNGHVLIEVVDDGVGGADTERGSGLRGLADRVEALGGRLRIWSPRTGGTTVRAEIPCGS